MEVAMVPILTAFIKQVRIILPVCRASSLEQRGSPRYQLDQTPEANTMNSNPKQLSYETYIAASPEKVWEGLTNGKMTKHYFYGGMIRGPIQKGATIAYVGEGEFRMLEGEVIEVEPQRRLVMTYRALWDAAVSKDLPSRVTWQLDPVGEATKLSLLHDQFQSPGPSYEQSASGWPVILSSMKTYLETGKTLKLQ
jgi:uncharacterized protein YndB with AHSA1/START domain